VLATTQLGTITEPDRYGASCIISDPTTHVYRISKSPDVGDTVDSIDAIEAFVHDRGRGRYHVDKIRRQQQMPPYYR
jgi:hypothetical protein